MENEKKKKIIPHKKFNKNKRVKKKQNKQYEHTATVYVARNARAHSLEKEFLESKKWQSADGTRGSKKKNSRENEISN